MYVFIVIIIYSDLFKVLANVVFFSIKYFSIYQLDLNWSEGTTNAETDELVSRILNAVYID